MQDDDVKPDPFYLPIVCDALLVAQSGACPDGRPLSQQGREFRQIVQTVQMTLRAAERAEATMGAAAGLMGR